MIIFLVLTLLLMAVGLAGTILPMIPSIPLIYGGFVLYGLATDWRDYGLGVMIVFGAVTVLIIVVDYAAGALGAKKFGASRAGMAGSVIGAVAGVIFLNLIGLVVGTFAGAVIGEVLAGRSTRDAVRSGWGAFVGFLAGSLFKLMTAVVMIATFVWLIVV